jgi:hypothetical protein
MYSEYLEALGGWPGVLAFVLVVSCIASIFGFRAPWSRASRMAAGPAVRAAEHAREAPEPRTAPAHQGFAEAARERLEPLLRDMIDRARAHGFEGRLEAAGEGQASTYRLEIRRPDHPAGQPLPYIAFSAGDAGLVEVIYGGVYPGPADHNRHDTEIGWRTVRWDQVDHALATFAHKVFARFD